jgi:hypothetical protein
MAERKSQPRKPDAVVDEEAQKRHDRFRLLTLLIGGVAVLELMVIVSGFLSGGTSNVSMALYIALGVTVAVGAAVWLVGRFMAPKQA